MLRLASILTSVVWAIFLIMVVRPTTNLAFGAVAALFACCAIILSVIAAVRRSRFAIRSSLIISVVAACWSGFVTWMIISPVTVVGVGFFGNMTVGGWLLLIGLLTMFSLPWLWGAVYHQVRDRESHPA